MTPKTKSGRSFLKWIHTWVGLTAGLVIAVVGLTGSVIVFRSEIERAQWPAAAGSTRKVGLDEVVLQIAQVIPEAKIRRVRLPAGAGDPYIVQVDFEGKQQRLVTEASTGRILGTQDTKWVDWMIDLHRNLLVGKTGRKAVGVVGVILFSLAATGLLLWVSGARRWRSWISVRSSQGGTRRFHFELHRAVGLWSYGLLSVIAFTGIGLSYPDSLRNSLQWITGGAAVAKAPRVAKSAAQPLRPLGEYLQTGVGAMPDGQPVELRLPEGKGPVDLRLRRRGDLSPSGNHVYMEPSTGRVLGISRAADQPFAARIFGAFSPIHYGEFGDLPIKLIWGIAGLMPSLLFVTGFITWWRPSQRKVPSPTVKEELTMAAGD